MVLLVIDTQELLMTNALYEFDVFVSNMKSLILCARQHGIEVIFVRHDDGTQEALTKGKEGYDIYSAFSPLENEKVYDKKVNSVFRDTGLLEYLKQHHEQEIIITGIQSDYCIHASVVCAFEHGFHVYVPAFANTTTDNAYASGEQLYRYHNEHMWNHRYATCLSMDAMLQKMKKVSSKTLNTANKAV